MKLLAIILAGLALQLRPQALATEITASSFPGVVIPDNETCGVADIINLSTAITSITDVQVTLDISGGFNGDYYAYLRHSDSSGVGFSVLLNRVGVTASNPYGSSDSGFSVTFSDSASGNIHSASAGGGALNGIFQPDGRNVSPSTAPGTLDSTSSTALLNSFNGMDANGDWTLFIADVSPVGIGTLEDWSLTIDGTGAAGVPDGGSTLGLMAIGLGFLAFCFRRRGAIQ